jgi:arylsulfatase A-like enzyme
VHRARPLRYPRPIATDPRSTRTRACARRALVAARVASTAIALVASTAIALLGCGSAPSERGVRIVLITLDTLRFDDFMGSGSAPSRMPRVRARAARGVVFEHFYAASSSTQPTHASMFTASHPWEHGVTRNGQILAADRLTVAEMLRDAGIETRAVVASFPVSSRFGFDQGFDSYVEEFGAEFPGRPRWEGEWEVPEGLFFSTAEAVTAAAMAALDGSRATRQFFWFHYFDPHSPYGFSVGGDLNRRKIVQQIQEQGADSEQTLRRARALYAADLGYLDGFLDGLLARLERDEPEYETHVLVVSDHGESFGEAGALGHGWRLSEEELRVPAFLLSPRLGAGLRDDVAGSVDVARTLLSLADLPAPAGTGGRDLTATPSQPTRAYGMRRTFRRSPTFELLVDGERREVEPLLFYAVEGDRRIRTGNGRAAADGPLAALFATFEARLDPSPAGDGLDPTSREALEALGYLE